MCVFMFFGVKCVTMYMSKVSVFVCVLSFVVYKYEFV